MSEEKKGALETMMSAPEEEFKFEPCWTDALYSHRPFNYEYVANFSNEDKELHETVKSVVEASAAELAKSIDEEILKDLIVQANAVDVAKAFDDGTINVLREEIACDPSSTNTGVSMTESDMSYEEMHNLIVKLSEDNVTYNEDDVIYNAGAENLTWEGVWGWHPMKVVNEPVIEMKFEKVDQKEPYR